MDRTVPQSAAYILDFIRETEVGSSDRHGYDVIYGFNQNRLPKPVTSMTVDEILASQRGWSNMFGSSATGGYQFMRATLRGLKSELGLGGNQILDPDLQDRLGYHLLKRRGYEAFIAGGSHTTFGNNLAKEWASFPVLSNIKGAHRNVERGETYYAGDQLNKALVSADEIEDLLKAAIGMSHRPIGAQPAVDPGVAAPASSPASEGLLAEIRKSGLNAHLLSDAAQSLTLEELRAIHTASQLALMRKEGWILTPQAPAQPTANPPAAAQPGAVPEKEPDMPAKPFFQSKTFWGIALIVASQFSPAAKVVLDALDLGSVAEGSANVEEGTKQLMTAAGAALAWFGRLRARLPLSLK